MASLSIDIFISKSKLKHPDKYSYLKTEYINGSTKVCITCPEHGDFWQSPNSHLMGHGCRKCGTVSRNKIVCLTNEMFIKQSNIKHKNFYNYLKVEYVNHYEKVIITCPIHGDFSLGAGKHLGGRGCQKCGFKKRRDAKTKKHPEFIKQLKDLNTYYSYDKVLYIGDRIKVIITCPIHGDFKQTPNNHLSGGGCRKCAGNEPFNNDSVDAIVLPKGIVRLDDYTGFESKINWKCLKCNHVWKTSFSSVKAAKYGCRRCLGLAKLTNEEVDKRLSGRNLKRVGNVKNVISKTEFACLKHNHRWYAVVNSVLGGCGCPKCSGSKGELKIHNFLIDNNFKFKSQFSFDDCKNPRTNYKLRFDFAVFNEDGSLKCLIEFDGVDHFLPNPTLIRSYPKRFSLENFENNQFKDNIKNQYCKEKNIKLIRLSDVESLNAEIIGNSIC